MQIRILTVLLIITGYTPLIGQQVLWKHKIELLSALKDRRQSFAVVNSGDSTVSLFLLDNNTINGFLFNSEFKLVDDFKTEILIGKFKNLSGVNVSEDAYNLFFTNDKCTGFSSISINYENEKVSEAELVLEFKDEIFVESFTYENKFFVITVQRKSSILCLYVFKDHSNFDKKVLDLSEYKFANDNFYELSYRLTNAEYIDTNIPNSIDVTSVSNKVYCYDDQLLITMDNETRRTILINIDLRTYKIFVKTYKQPSISCGNTYNFTANSYLYDDALYQLKMCPSEFVFSIHDIRGDTLVKQLRTNKSEEITFRNSGIFQDGGLIPENGEKEIFKTSKFLRAASSGKAGLSVYSRHDTLEVTLGGYQVKDVTSSTGGFGGISVFYSYKYSKSSYFKTLLKDVTYERIEGKVHANGFDKIRDFTELNKDVISVETLFKMGSAYIFGYYASGKREYVLMQFNE